MIRHLVGAGEPRQGFADRHIPLSKLAVLLLQFIGGCEFQVNWLRGREAFRGEFYLVDSCRAAAPCLVAIRTDRAVEID